MTPRCAVWENAQQLPLFLQGVGWLLAGLAGFLAGLAWLLAVWFGFGWLSGWFGLASGWLVWLGSWLAFWLVLAWLSFFHVFFSSPCAAGHFASISRGHYFAATRLHAVDGRVPGASQVE